MRLAPFASRPRLWPLSLRGLVWLLLMAFLFGFWAVVGYHLREWIVSLCR
jgi:hypothetical protein